MTLNLEGIFTPVITPFLKEKITYDLLSYNICKLSKTGIKGIVVLGSTGESVFLSNEEKINIVKKSIHLVPKSMKIIVGSGCESTIETIRLTNIFAKLGVSAALIITPSYYIGKMKHEALIKHYFEIADNCNIPIILYNVPKFTHLNLDVKIVATLAKHPNIIGIKDSSGNINQLGQYINNTNKDFNVLVGTAGVLLGALTLGCKGGILALANLVPEYCVKIFKLIKENKVKEARLLQLKLIPVNQAITAVYGIGGLKYAMDLLGYRGGDTRLPLLPISAIEKKEIKSILMKAGFFEK